MATNNFVPPSIKVSTSVLVECPAGYDCPEVRACARSDGGIFYPPISNEESFSINAAKRHIALLTTLVEIAERLVDTEKQNAER